MYKIIDGCKVSPRYPWYECDDYRLEYEFIEGEIYIHAYVENFNKAVMKDIGAKFNDFKLHLANLGYSWLFSYTKDLRLVRFYDGWVELGDTGEAKVIGWELQKQSQASPQSQEL